MITIPTLRHSHLFILLPHLELGTVRLTDDITVAQFAILAPDILRHEFVTGYMAY